MARKYVFWGGYAGNNLGDEAILWAMSRLIRKLDPEAEQHVFIPDGITPAVQAQYTAWGIKLVSGPMLRCLAILRHARLIVGGGQMIDDSSNGWPVGWSSIFIAINWIFGQRPLVLCVGAERLTKRLPRFLVQRFYGLAEIITCRDEESASSVRAVGVPADKVWTTRDVVFSLDTTILPQRKASGNGPRSVAVAVAYDPTRVLEDISRYAILISALRSRDFTVELVAHDLRAAYDIGAVAEVKARFAEDDRVGVAEVANVAEAFHLYSRVDAVISARMHPLIMGMLAGTLPVAFGGKAKVKSLLHVTAIPTINPGEEPAQLMSVFEVFLERSPALLPQLAESVSAFRRDVEEATAKALRLRRP